MTGTARLGSAFTSPWKSIQHRVRYWAHERPVLFYSVLLGSLGPIFTVTVPPIRRNFFGYVSPEPIPTSYPLPKRRRRELTGYEDEE